MGIGSDSGNAIVGRRIVVSWKGPEASSTTYCSSLAAASAASHSSVLAVCRPWRLRWRGSTCASSLARALKAHRCWVVFVNGRLRLSQPIRETVHYHGGIAGVRWWFAGWETHHLNQNTSSRTHPVEPSIHGSFQHYHPCLNYLQNGYLYTT